MRWFDTHCHLDDLPDDALAQARAAGVFRFVVPGVVGVPETAARRAAGEEGLGYTVGVHPLFLDQVADFDATLAAMRAALRSDPRCVGVGEVGLDFWQRPDAATRARQVAALRAQLALADEIGCPVVVHLRKGGAEFLAIAAEHRERTWVMHMFSGAPDFAEALARRLPRVFFGFGGPAARANARKPVAVLRAVDRDRILLETDAPDLTPPPLAPPNRPSYLPWIGARLADLLDVTVEELAALTWANAERAFRTTSWAG